MMRAALILSGFAACSGLGAQMSWPHKSSTSSSSPPGKLQAKDDPSATAKLDEALRENAQSRRSLEVDEALSSLKLGAEGGDMDSPDHTMSGKRERGRKRDRGAKNEPDWVGYQAAKAELHAVEAREEALEA